MVSVNEKPLVPKHCLIFIHKAMKYADSLIYLKLSVPKSNQEFDIN
jgi:hypothetical protein